MDQSWCIFMSIRLRKALLFFRILLPDMIFWQSLEGGRAQSKKSNLSPRSFYLLRARRAIIVSSRSL